MLIPPKQLVEQFSLQITGILHIGAHECEELQSYKDIGVQMSNMYWVEALSDKVDMCKRKYGSTLNIYPAVIDERDGEEVTFNITNNAQSSSILEFGTHARNHPYVHVVNKVAMHTTRLDTLIVREHIPMHLINFVNLDIQGVELRALKSMGIYLGGVKYIYTEVNTEEVYKDCNLIGEIDDYLSGFGFKRVAQKIYDEYGWGDALYMKS